MLQKRKTVGIDLGTATTKAVCLVEGPDGLMVDKVKIVETPPDPNDQIQLLRHILAEFRAGQFALSLPGRFALVRCVAIPARASAKIDATLKIEVQHRIPFPLDQVFWDSRRLADGGDSHDFLVCAVKKDIVRKFFAPLYDVPEEILFLDVDPLVLLNLLHTLPEFNPSRACAVLDLGRESSNLVISRRNLVLVRSLTVNGNSYTDILREDRDMADAAAEEAKRVLPAGEIPESVAGVTETLATEIQSSFDYWRLTQKGEPVEVLFLCGGGALVAGLKPALENRFNITVRQLDPFAGLKTRAGMDIPANARAGLAVACGLARRLAVPRDTPYPMNFLPREYARLQAGKRNRVYLFLSALLAVVLAFTPSAFLYMESRVRETLIGHLNADLQEYEKFQPQVDDLTREISDLQGRYESLHGTLNQRYLWLTRLIAVGRILPSPNTYFTRFTPSTEGNTILLDGQVRGPSVSLNFRDFRQLIINLDSHPFFSDVVVNSVERQDNWLVFSLTVSVAETSPGAPPETSHGP